MFRLLTAAALLAALAQPTLAASPMPSATGKMAKPMMKKPVKKMMPMKHAMASPKPTGMMMKKSSGSASSGGAPTTAPGASAPASGAPSTHSP